MLEPLQTLGTLVGFLPCMHPQVGQQVGFPGESPTALITLERLFSSVSSLVEPDLIIIQELLPTETASFVVQLFVMSLLVTVTHSLSIKPLPTLGTHKLLQVQMRIHMALVGIFPWETFLADFTGKRLQSRMYSFPVSKTV